MKGGPLGVLLPVLGGIAALGTGLGAAGIGPLSGLFSAGGAGADAGAAAAGLGGDFADAGGLAAGALPGAATDLATAGAIPTAADAGMASSLGIGAPSFGSVPLMGDAAAGSAGTLGATGDIGAAGPMGAIGDAGAVPTATSLVGDTLPTTLAANDLISPSLGAVSSSAPIDAAAGAAGGFSNPFDAGLSAAGTDMSGAAAGTDMSGAAAGASDVGTPGSGGDFASGGTSWWQNPRNYLSMAPLALLLGERLFGGNQVPGSGPVTQAAQTAATNEGILTGQGTQNISYINTGALPAGAQTAIDQAANAAKTQIASSFASMGIPAGSTMERQQMAAVDENTAVQKFDIQNKLLQSGISEFNTAGGFGSQVTQADLALMQAQIQQEQELEAAVANFAGAAAAGWNFG